MDEQLISLAKLRLMKAQERLRDAKSNYNSAAYETAINRAYYAVFACMRSVVNLEGKDFKKHSGLISYFRKTYIKSQELNSRLSDIITITSMQREAADYDDNVECSAEMAKECVECAEEFYYAANKYVERRIAEQDKSK